MGDENGIVVARIDFTDKILRRLFEQRQKLSQYVEDVECGFFSKEWIDEHFALSQCKIYE